MRTSILAPLLLLLACGAPPATDDYGRPYLPPNDGQRALAIAPCAPPTPQRRTREDCQNAARGTGNCSRAAADAAGVPLAATSWIHAVCVPADDPNTATPISRGWYWCSKPCYAATITVVGGNSSAVCFSFSC